MPAILFAQFIKWHFYEAPKNILHGWGNFVWFNANFFSVGLLMRTFFSPWRNISWEHQRAFSVGDRLFTLGSNIISRILGAIVRAPLIVVGLAGYVVIGVAGIGVLFFWLLLPVIIPITFLYGLKLIF
jgi:hypothetical protein